MFKDYIVAGLMGFACLCLKKCAMSPYVSELVKTSEWLVKGHWSPVMAVGFQQFQLLKILAQKY